MTFSFPIYKVGKIIIATPLGCRESLIRIACMMQCLEWMKHANSAIATAATASNFHDNVKYIMLCTMIAYIKVYHNIRNKFSLGV